MKYKVKKDNIVFEVDDTILLANQPEEFQKVFNENRQGDRSGFDNAYIILLDSGRIIVTIKESKDGKI